MAENTPFFIVGSPRSGTTLLRLILTGHSRIAIPPETWFFLALVNRFPLVETLSPNNVKETVEAITKDRRFPNFGISPEEFRSRVDHIPDKTLADISSILYREYMRKELKPRFGDKTPGYIRIIPQLAQIFPNAKFINLIRDGRDVSISFINAKFKGRFYHGRRFEWIQAFHYRQSLRNTFIDRHILDVRYEELVLNPEDTIRKICSFINETYEPSMMNFGTRANHVLESWRHIHGKLSRPIRTDDAQVWRGCLSGFECLLMEACLYRELVALGYPLRFSSRLWRPAFAVIASLLRLSAPLLDRAIPALRRRNLLPRNVYV
jgi:hypothetical protein